MEAEYNNHYDRICEEAERCDIDGTAALHNEFTFFSANLEHFLPLVPLCQHKQLFRKSLVYHRLGAMDVEFGAAGHLPRIMGLSENWVARLQKQPGIIASAHTGAHVLIAIMLAKKDVPLALLVASHLKERLTNIWQRFANAHPRLKLPVIVDAASPMAPRRLIKLAKEGVNLLIYWDGRQGMGELANTGEGVIIPFLGQHLLLRRGIPFIAHAADAPVYPMLCFRQRDRSVACFTQPELVGSGVPPTRFAAHALQTLAAHFASLLIHFPAQWYNWAQLQHQVLPKRYVMESGRVLSSRYGILKRPGKYFLFERQNYRTVELEKDLLAHIQQYATND